MKKHGLGFTQLMQGTSLETRIFHVESGEYLQSFADIPQDVQLKGMNNFQVAGSAITYFRRYALSSALGLVTDKDTETGGAPTFLSEPVMFKLDNGTKFICGGLDAVKQSEYKPKPLTNNFDFE